MRKNLIDPTLINLLRVKKLKRLNTSESQPTAGPAAPSLRLRNLPNLLSLCPQVVSWRLGTPHKEIQQTSTNLKVKVLPKSKLK